MQSVKGSLSITLYVDCPHCKELINLMDNYYNDDGQIYDIVVNRNHNVDIGHEFNCGECGEELTLEAIYW